MLAVDGPDVSEEEVWCAGLVSVAVRLVLVRCGFGMKSNIVVGIGEIKDVKLIMIGVGLGVISRGTEIGTGDVNGVGSRVSVGSTGVLL